MCQTPKCLRSLRLPLGYIVEVSPMYWCWGVASDCLVFLSFCVGWPVLVTSAATGHVPVCFSRCSELGRCLCDLSGTFRHHVTLVAAPTAFSPNVSGEQPTYIYTYVKLKISSGLGRKEIGRGVLVNVKVGILRVISQVALEPLVLLRTVIEHEVEHQVERIM